MKPAELNVYLWRDGFHLFFPMRGVDRWRVIGILPPHLRQRDEVELADVEPHVRAAVGTGLQFTRCLWFSRCRIHHRRAERFRAGRCYLLGDAAHPQSDGRARHEHRPAGRLQPELETRGGADARRAQ